MSETCKGSDMAPYTWAAAPLDEWDRMQLVADLNSRRRERLRNSAGAAALTVTRIEAHSESDQRHLEDAEGEQ